MLRSHWKQIAYLLTGIIMTTTIFAGTGRGDFHTLYRGQSIDDLIITYMEENNIPGLTLAIVQAPYITRIVGYGLANTQTKLLAATHTVFNIGQLTNAYTAVAIMQLKEAGKLALDDPISKYLADVPKNWQAITIRDLLTHSSGLPSYTDAAGFDYSKEYTSAQILALIKEKELLFAPGSKANNSSSDHYLLGLIIEKASGMSYQAYVTKNQIDRVGLKHTFFVAHQNDIKNEINNGTNPYKHKQFLQDPVFISPTELATGYTETNGTLVADKAASWSATFADSGIIASAEDISLWDVALAGEILVKDPQDRAFLYNPVTLKNGQIIPENVGWFFPGHKGMMEIRGALPGYSAFLSRFTDPTELVCVTLLANKSGLPDLDILARKIAGALDGKLAAPMSSTRAETLESPYSVQETMDRVAAIVKAQGGTIFARINHSEEASKVGQNLPATQVLLIGNPAKGTELMQANAQIALDLPLRIMATTDNTGHVWLSFTDPIALAKEYNLEAKQIAALKQMSTALRKLCEKAISPYSLGTS